MKNTIKKVVLFLFFLLIVSLIFGLQADASATQEWDISADGSKSLVAIFSEKDNLLIIRQKDVNSNQKVKMKDWNAENEVPWFSIRNKIGKIVISEGVQNIGNYAFSDFNHAILIPNSVSKIGKNSCSNQAKIYCESDSFANQYAKENENITNNEHLWNISDSTTPIKAVLFDDNTLVIVGTGQMLIRTPSSNSLWDTDRVKKVIIGDGVKNIQSAAFYECYRLTDITIPNTVTRIESDAFNGCTSLKSIIIPNSVTSIGSNAFRKCANLTDITIPNGVTTIGDYAFDDCIHLESVTIPSSVTSIGANTFINCPNLEVIHCNKDSYAEQYAKEHEIAYSIDNMWDISVNEDNSVIAVLDHQGSLLKISGTGAMKNYTYDNLPPWSEKQGINNISIQEGVTNIGSLAFNSCSALHNVSIADSVTIIEASAFQACTGLTNVIIPNNIASIASLAFVGCNNLSSVTIKNKDVIINTGAFLRCSEDLVIYCYEGSTAQSYAIENNIKYELLPEETKDKSKVKLSVINANMHVGESFGITASLDGDEDVDDVITWSSDNSNVATVDQNGKVTAIAAGKAVITAHVKSDYALKYMDNTCLVTVYETSNPNNPNNPNNPSNPDNPTNPNDPSNPNNPDDPNNGNNQGNGNNTNNGNNQGNGNTSGNSSSENQENSSNQSNGNFGNNGSQKSGSTSRSSGNLNNGNSNGSKESISGMKDTSYSEVKELPKTGNQTIQIILLTGIIILTTVAIICYKKSKIE